MYSHPLISVIVNCYNGEKFLNKSITSILDQTYQNFEIIFWNNKSFDNSLSIIRNYNDNRIKIFDSENHTNISVARNNAIKKSIGEYICFLDVDDYWNKYKLEKQIESFKFENVGLSFTNFWYVKSSKNMDKKKSIDLKFEKGLINQMIKKYEIVLSTIMVKKNVLENFKSPFDETYHIIGDFDFALKISHITKFYHIKEHLTYRVWHGKNESIKKREIGVSEVEDWLTKNTKEYNNYPNEIDFLKKKVFYDKINFKIKNKKFTEAIIIFLKNNYNFKLSYLKNIFSRFVD